MHFVDVQHMMTESYFVVDKSRILMQNSDTENENFPSPLR